MVCNGLGNVESMSLWLTQSWRSQVCGGLAGIFIFGMSELVRRTRTVYNFPSDKRVGNFPNYFRIYSLAYVPRRIRAVMGMPQEFKSYLRLTFISNIFLLFVLTDDIISATGRWPRRTMIQLRWCQPKCPRPQRRRVRRWKNLIKNPIILQNQPLWATQQICLSSWSDASPKD